VQAESKPRMDPGQQSRNPNSQPRMDANAREWEEPSHSLMTDATTAGGGYRTDSFTRSRLAITPQMSP
jgi:hypothetical protein